MKTAKQDLTAAFSQLQSAQISLKVAMEHVEKQNNKHQIQNTLLAVDEAVFIAGNAVANYQE